MNLNFEKIYTKNGLEIQGLLKLSPKVFSDDRGFFLESWNKKNWDYLLEKCNQKSQEFVQDNHSKSSKGVLRGLHYQLEPFAQGKLVRVVSGEVFDVAVDIRKNSSTFAQWAGIKLNSSNHYQLWIPAGYAHGFLVLSDHADVHYKTTEYWSKEHERSIRWNDPSLSINWPKLSNEFNISYKDKNALFLEEI